MIYNYKTTVFEEIYAKYYMKFELKGNIVKLKVIDKMLCSSIKLMYILILRIIILDLNSKTKNVPFSIIFQLS